MIAAVVLSWMMGAAPGAAAPDPKTAAVHATTVVVDLNRATLEELTRLPGIGPKRAEAILARRHQQPFTRVTQLLEVKGIGRKTLDRLKPHVRVSVPAAPVQAAAPPH